MNQKLALYRYKTAKFLHLHQAFVILVTVLLLLVFVAFRINTLSNLPMDEAYYTKQTSQLKTVRFNQEAIKQIEELRDSNVTAPGTSLPKDRTNPFVE